MPALSRRKFMAASVTLPHAVRTLAATPEQRVYIGTDTDLGKSKGIYTALWDPAARRLGVLSLAVETSRPVLMASSGRHIYVTNESGGTHDPVSAFTRERDGSLRLLNQVKADGGPTYISVHPSGRAAYVANYGSGSLTSYAIAADGKLSGPVAHFQYTGHGPNVDRQKSSHAHSAQVSPDGRFVLVNDLGLDQIHIYRIHATHPAQLTPNSPDAWHGKPGSGPRHIAFTPNGRTVYNINEMGSTIDLLAWDANAGVLTAVGDPISTLAAGFTGVNTAAEVLVSPDGRFLYASNRGEDTVVVFTIHSQDQSLAFLQRIACGGKTPRQMTLSPDGTSLLVGNQDSATIAIFACDPVSGMLTTTPNSVTLPDPMFILFV